MGNKKVDKKTKRIILALIIMTCCVLLVLGGLLFRTFLDHDEFLGSSENFVNVVKYPLTLEQARKNLRLPLPDEARDIYYAHYAQWIAYDFIVKFKAPIEICKSHALLLIEQYNKNEKNAERHLPLKFTEITQSPQIAQLSQPLNVDWFDIHNIENGFTIGGNNPLQPFIWIDVDRDIFYYRLED